MVLTAAMSIINGRLCSEGTGLNESPGQRNVPLAASPWIRMCRPLSLLGQQGLAWAPKTQTNGINSKTTYTQRRGCIRTRSEAYLGKLQEGSSRLHYVLRFHPSLSGGPDALHEHAGQNTELALALLFS